MYDAVLAAARRVTIPIDFLLPWDDDEIVIVDTAHTPQVASGGRRPG